MKIATVKGEVVDSNFDSNNKSELDEDSLQEAYDTQWLRIYNENRLSVSEKITLDFKTRLIKRCNFWKILFLKKMEK